MVIVSITERPWKGSWVCIALLWSIRKFQKVFLRLSWSVPSGFPILRGIEVIGYFDASLKLISSPRMTPNACLSSFITDIALGVFFTFNTKSNLKFHKFIIAPFTNLSMTKVRYFSLPILPLFNSFLIISLWSYFPVVMLLRLPLQMGRTHKPQLLLKSLHIWQMQFPGTRGTFFMARISLQFNFLVKYTS